jgi:plasmid stability protein
MSDILIHDVSEDLKRRLEERARVHGRNVSDEAEALLENVFAERPPRKPGLGTILSNLVPMEFRGDDFVCLRDYSERPPPDFGDFE